MLEDILPKEILAILEGGNGDSSSAIEETLFGGGDHNR